MQLHKNTMRTTSTAARGARGVPNARRSRRSVTVRAEKASELSSGTAWLAVRRGIKEGASSVPRRHRAQQARVCHKPGA